MKLEYCLKITQGSNSDLLISIWIFQFIIHFFHVVINTLFSIYAQIFRCADIIYCLCVCMDILMEFIFIVQIKFYWFFDKRKFIAINLLVEYITPVGIIRYSISASRGLVPISVCIQFVQIITYYIHLLVAKLTAYLVFVLLAPTIQLYYYKLKFLTSLITINIHLYYTKTSWISTLNCCRIFFATIPGGWIMKYNYKFSDV